MIRNLLYCVLISLVLLTPFMYSDELYNGTISAKQIWFYGSMGLLILGFALENLFARKKESFRLNPVDISLLAFYSYFFIRACYTPYTPILYNQKFLNYSLLVLFYFIVKHACSKINISKNNFFLREDHPVIVTITIVLMLTGVVEAIWGLLQLYGFIRSFHSGFKITGTFFNPAPYALYLAVIFPIALRVLMNELKNERISGNEELRNERINGYMINGIGQLISSLPSRYKTLKNRCVENPNSFILSFLHSFILFVAWLTVISILLVLPATMNRASWVGVGVSSFLILNQKYHLIVYLRRWLKTEIRKILVATGLLILVAPIVIGLFQFKKGSSIGRLLIWEVTAGKIAKKPLFGHGVGRFEAEYTNWQAEYFQNHPEEMDGPKGMVAGNTKYCFNEYLEMASELGIIGIILFLIVFLSLLISLIGVEFSRNSFIFSFLNSSISLFVCALISYPFYSLSTLIMLFLLLAMISSSINGIERYKHLLCKNGFQYGIRLAWLLLLVPVLLFLFNQAKEQYRNGYNMDEGVMFYQIQSYREACRSFEEVYPSSKYSGQYLQYYGKALSMKGDVEESVEILERAKNFTSDEILYTNLGDSYRSLKKYLEAEKNYIYASNMVPHKVYPLYLLANLYAETGQGEKTLKTAEELINKKIKIKSTATDEIIQAMNLLIEKTKKENK